jgi:hypothetical protein
MRAVSFASKPSSAQISPWPSGEGMSAISGLPLRAGVQPLQRHQEHELSALHGPSPLLPCA